MARDINIGRVLDFLGDRGGPAWRSSHAAFGRHGKLVNAGIEGRKRAEEPLRMRMIAIPYRVLPEGGGSAIPAVHLRTSSLPV